MSQTLLIRKMGVQPKLEDIEAMEQDPPPLSEIKTGYTPTTTASAGESAHDFSHYENLDTPTPIRPTDLMAYTRFEPGKWSVSLIMCAFILSHLHILHATL